MNIRGLLSVGVMLVGTAVAACMSGGRNRGSSPAAPDAGASDPVRPDTVAADTGTQAWRHVQIDSVPAADKDTRYTELTEDDFRRVANELQVEVAAIKAVVVIEAGQAMEGFWAPGVPVVNCDRSMWGTVRRQVKSHAKAPASTTIPPGLKSAFARKAWQKLVNARKQGIEQANLSTFWGMFQIGGFNYKLCGCSSIKEFVDLMSYSELEQLELFAALIMNTGQVKYLRQKNWAAFARSYNGPSYARRGYHTKMANAYRRFSKGK